MHPGSVFKGGKLFNYLKEEMKRQPKFGRVDLPTNIGKGYVRKVGLYDKMNMLIVQCILKTDEKGSRNTTPNNEEYISFSFRNLHNITGKLPSSLLPYIQISSSNMELDLFLPAKVQINNIIIGVKIDYLKELLSYCEGNEILDTILANNQPFLYEEIVTSEIVEVAKLIFEFANLEVLPDLFYKLKAEELIYYFFVALLKRKEPESYPINQDDIRIIYNIRNLLLIDLTACPSLDVLSVKANMSVSKMSRLFKQVFGQSIYNYHQKLRIAEAAKLIKTQNKSVSEAGFDVGFNNMSHFSRLFERYVGMKPKRYSKEG